MTLDEGDRDDEHGLSIHVIWLERITVAMIVALAGLMAVARLKAAAMMPSHSKDDSFVLTTIVEKQKLC